MAISINPLCLEYFYDRATVGNGNESSIVEGTQWVQVVLVKRRMLNRKAKWGKNHTAISRFDKNHFAPS